MTDSFTKKRRTVSADDTARPYLFVQLDQLAAVRQLLDHNRIPYWVDETAISVDGQPAVTVINLSAGVEAQRVQATLDSAA
jgi:hypothetical protein